jgi:hypothetical protein
MRRPVREVGRPPLRSVSSQSHGLTPARQIGFHIITTRNQYIRPVILNDEANARKLDEVNEELGYLPVAHEARWRRW